MRPPSLKAADFQRALGCRPVARTAHFVLHALPRSTQAEDAAIAVALLDSVPGGGAAGELSTSEAWVKDGLVDDSVASLSAMPGLPAWRFGLVLPKKQARRSVTRSLIRHQAREALRRHALAVFADGRHEVEGWVLRLKTPFDRQQFPSAASDALKAAVRLELDELWARLIAPSSKGVRMPPGSTPVSGGKPRGGA